MKKWSMQTNTCAADASAGHPSAATRYSNATQSSASSRAPKTEKRKGRNMATQSCANAKTAFTKNVDLRPKQREKLGNRRRASHYLCWPCLGPWTLDLEPILDLEPGKPRPCTCHLNQRPWACAVCEASQEVAYAVDKKKQEKIKDVRIPRGLVPMLIRIPVFLTVVFFACLCGISLLFAGVTFFPTWQLTVSPPRVSHSSPLSPPPCHSSTPRLIVTLFHPVSGSYHVRISRARSECGLSQWIASSCSYRVPMFIRRCWPWEQRDGMNIIHAWVMIILLPKHHWFSGKKM